MSFQAKKPFASALRVMSLLLALSTLVGCGGGGGSDNGNSDDKDKSIVNTQPLEKVLVTVNATQTKVLSFSWNDVGADHYKLLKNPDGLSGYSQLGADLRTTSVDEPIAVHMQDWVNASYIVQSCNAESQCTDSEAISATTAMLDAIGYFKASNAGSNDSFGYSVALSADGNTLAVGARGEGPAAGAVYVFARTDGVWKQQAYIKASNAEKGDYFGGSVTLSAEGNILAVGAKGEGSATKGINEVQSDNNAQSAGAVYVFTRTGGAWKQQAYIKASNAEAGDRFGTSVALSAEGNTLAVGAWGEGSAATGINGGQSDNSASNAGAVYVFTRTGGVWTQQAYIKASNTGVGDWFGFSVALSAEGNTLAVGAWGEGSAATGINGGQSDNSASNAGAVYVFTRTGGVWTQQAYIKASNSAFGDNFGASVTLSAEGNTLAVGADREASAATGINGDQSDNTADDAGAVYLFTRTGGVWSQQAYIKASNAESSDYFGVSVALSAEGNTLAVGAEREASAATGINGDQSDNGASYAGAVYLFARTDGAWTQQAYIKASNTGTEDWFGFSVALSAEGNTLAVSAYGEASAATGINGDQSDNSVSAAGAVYVY